MVLGIKGYDLSGGGLFGLGALFEMDKYPLFYLPRRLLRFFKCWPDDTYWPLSRLIFVGLTLTNHIAAMFFEFKYAFEQLANPLEAFDALNPTLTKFVTFFKVCAVLYFRKEFKYNHEKISSYFDKEYRGDHYQIVYEATRSAYRYCLYTFVGGSSVNFCFFLRPIANSVFRVALGGNSTRELPFKASLPFNLDEYPTYPIVYGLFSYSGLLTCFTFPAVDGIIMTYCKYIAAQFDIISNQLRTHFDAVIVDSTEPFTQKEMQTFAMKLRPVVRLHIELINRIVELSKIIWPIILVHFISSALLIGLSLLDFMKSEGFGTILYLIYAGVVLLQLLVYCIAGNCVASSSQGIHESVYFTYWYRFNSKIRRDLLIIMIISTKEKNLRIPFFTPSLPAYRAILSASLSYLAILQSFF